MTLVQLRTFLAVVRSGSVRAAAEALCVTEPSVSAALKSMQFELGVPLTARRGRGISITPAGREFADHAVLILEASDAAVRRMREFASRTSRIELAAVVTAGEFLMTPVLRLLRQFQPGVAVHMEVGNMSSVVNNLFSSRAEVGIGGRPPDDGQLVGEPFLPNPLIVVAAPDHRLASRSHLEPFELEPENWLVREPGSGTRRNTEELFAAAQIVEPKTMTLGSNGAIKQAAAVGLGVALISAHAVAADLEAGTLVRLPVEGTPVRRDWHALYLAGEKPSQSVLDFISLLRSPAAQQSFTCWCGESSRLVAQQ